MRKLQLLAAVLAVVIAITALKPAAAAGTPTGVTIKEMLAANAVVNNNPADLAKTVGWIRDYHKWYWYEGTNGAYTWSSGWQKLDSFYGTLKAAGVKVMPDVEFAPGWASSNGKTDGIPNATEHAQYLHDLVAHYGDTIAAVENFNEPNQTWQPVRFPANQFGPMAGKDYAAVKSANPSMTFVLAGMAGADTTYLTAAKNAGAKFDVVNFHWYAEGDTTSGGKNPEAGDLFVQIDKMKAWRDANAPGKPIWISEFGWDTYKQASGAKSKIYAPEANAANYLLRAVFLMQGRGIEKSFVYIYRDVSDNATYLHNIYLSSGLVTNSGEKDSRKKPGWYYLATLKGVLGDYVLDHIVSNGPNIYRYEYAQPGTSKKAAVMWARNGVRDNGYTAKYKGPAGTLVVPTDGSATGVTSTTDGNLTLTERPVFVLYDDGAPATATTVPTSAPTSVPTATTVPTTVPTAVPTATSVPTTVPVTVTPAATQTAVPNQTAVPTATPAPTSSTGTAAVEKLANGTFESGLASWFVPSWFAGVTKADSTLPHAGAQSIHFQGYSKGTYSYQEIAAQPGDKVSFSGWVNIPERKGGQSLVVELVPRHAYNGDLTKTTVATINTTTSGWTQISGAATMPDRTANVRMQIRFPELNGNVYLDDLSLKVAGN